MVRRAAAGGAGVAPGGREGCPARERAGRRTPAARPASRAAGKGAGRRAPPGRSARRWVTG